MGGRAGLDQANRGTQKTSLGKPGGSPRCGVPGQGVQSQHPQQEKKGLSCPSLGLQRDPVTPRWTPRPLKCDWCLRRRKPGENDGLTAGSESKGGLPDPPAQGSSPLTHRGAWGLAVLLRRLLSGPGPFGYPYLVEGRV